VIETVPIDFPSVFPVGVLIALAAKRQIETENVGFFSRYVGAGALFGLVFGLSVGWFCFNYPDWMWVYGVPVDRWSVWWWYPPFLLGLTITGAAGALFAQALLARRRPWLAVGVGLIGLYILVVFWSMTWEPYQYLSTYEQWHAEPRVAIPIQDDPRFMTAMNIAGPIQGVVFLLLVGRFLLEGRRIPPP
jgi:hypothetical protein